MPQAKHTIHYSDLDGQKVLNDGDRIHVFQSAGVDPSKVTIVLNSRVTWWKGIQADSVVLSQCQDSQNISQADVNIDIVHGKGIQLWKAKDFGVHVDMYDITDVKSWALGGKVYTFIWQND
jgi:hypothetical protein